MVPIKIGLKDSSTHLIHLYLLLIIFKLSTTQNVVTGDERNSTSERSCRIILALKKTFFAFEYTLPCIVPLLLAYGRRIELFSCHLI
jgi:hypothetical protein